MAVQAAAVMVGAGEEGRALVPAAVEGQEVEVQEMEKQMEVEYALHRGRSGRRDS